MVVLMMYQFLWISQFPNFNTRFLLLICARGLTDKATASGAVNVGSIPAGRVFLGVEFGKSATSPDFQKVLLGKSGRVMRSIGLRRCRRVTALLRLSLVSVTTICSGYPQNMHKMGKT